jgi:hypothetical protein
VDFRVLGPVEARAEGRPLALGGARQRALLAVLLLRVEFAAVVGAMAAPVERNNAVRLVAAAERARHEMCRIDRPLAADQA